MRPTSGESERTANIMGVDVRLPRANGAEHTEWRWLSAICALAILLRCLKLDQPLWYDEILTLARFVRLPTSALLTTYTSLNNHVLYSLEAKASIAVFGESAWSLRLPAVFFGVAGIAALYYLAREAVDVWEARTTALLLAVSYHHIWFSQNARGYTGLLFWTLLATTIAVRHFRNPSWRPWLAYACAVAAAGFTHLSGALFFTAHGAVFGFLYVRERFWLKREQHAAPLSSGPETDSMGSGRRPIIALALGAVLTVMLHGAMIPQMLATFSSKAVSGDAEAVSKPVIETGANADWNNPLWTAMEIVRSLSDLGVLIAPALPVALVLLVIGGTSLWRRSPLFTGIYAFHIPITMLMLVGAGLRIWPRYFFLDIGFLFICVTRGIFVTAELLAHRFKLAMRFRISSHTFARVAGLCAVATSLVLLPKNYRYPKQDFEGALRFVKRAQRPQDSVAVVGLANLPYEEFYKPGWTKVETVEQLAKVREPAGATWLVYAFASHTRSHHPAVMAVVEAEFKQKRVLPGTLGEGEVYVWRSER